MNVLIVDDEPHIRSLLSMCLADHHEVAQAASVAEALARLRESEFDIAFVDLRLGDGDGLQVLRAAPPPTAVIVMTAFGTVETAVEAMRSGAADYLQKPFTAPQVIHAVERVARERSVRGELADLRAQAGVGTELVAVSAPMKKLLALAARAAPSEATVLLRGESGTGKGILARYLHRALAAQRRAVRGGRTGDAVRRRCSRASCSATCAARSPAPSPSKRGRFETAQRRHAVSRRDRRAAAVAAAEVVARWCRTDSSSASARASRGAATCG